MTEELQTIMPLVNEIVDTMLQLEKVGIMADNFEKCELRMYLDDMMTYYPDNYVDTELNSMILTRMYEYYNDKADELCEKLESSLDDDYIHEAGSIIRKIKQVASDFHELNPGVASIIGCVQYNMKYTQLKQGKEQFKWK